MSSTENLFTIEDVNLVINGKQNNSGGGFLDKLKRTTPSNSYNIENLKPIYTKLSKDANPKYFYEKSDVDNIYAIGDINADYLTLVKMLIGFGLIEYDDKTEIKINNPDLISTVKWVAPEKTMLVICGNIIGGWNSGGYSTKHRLGLNENTDVKRNIDNGDNEMLIHMFLRNIKLLAKENNSDVMLVYGDIKDNLFHSVDPVIHDGYDKTNYSIPKVAVDKYSKYNSIKENNYGTRYNLLRKFYEKNVTLYFAIIENGKKLILSDIYILFINGNWLGLNGLLNVEEVKYSKPLIKDGENEHISKQIQPYKMIYKPMKDFKEFTIQSKYNFQNLKEPNLFIYKDFDIKPTGKFITVHSNKPNSYQRYAQQSTDERPCSKIKTQIKHMDVYTQSDDTKLLFENTAQCIYPMEYNENNIPQMININSSISDAEQSKQENTYSEILKITNINESPDFYALSLDNNSTVVEYKLNTDKVKEYVDSEEENVKNTINKTHSDLIKENNGKDRFVRLINDPLLVSDGSIPDEDLKGMIKLRFPKHFKDTTQSKNTDGGKKRKQRRYLKSKKARKSRKSRRKSSKRSRGRR